MSESEPTNIGKYQYEGQDKSTNENKQAEVQKNVQSSSSLSKQQSNKQTSNIHPEKINSADSQKSQSRERSRQKNYGKQIKAPKRAQQEQHHRNERTFRDRNDRRKSYNHPPENKFFNDQNVKQQAYRKTKMCPQFERGQCRKGADCNFAHSQSQLRGLPDFRKTKLCIAFKEGKCGKLSSQCKYAHGENQLKRMPKVSTQSEQRKQRSPKRQKQYNIKHPNYGYTQPPTYPSYIPPQNPYMSNYFSIKDPYIIPAPMNPNQYMPPQMPPNRLPINNFNPHTRPFSSDYISQPNPINPNVNFGNFGSLGPTGGFYPAPVYDPYGHYPMPPPPNYGYPPGPKPPM